MNDGNVAGDASARRREDEAAAAAALVGVAHQQPRLGGPPPAAQQHFAPHVNAIAAANVAAAAEGGGATTSASHASYIPRSPSDRQCFTWRRISPPGLVPPPRSGAASVVVKGRLYIFGGYGGGTGRLDDFFSINLANLDTSCWEEVKVKSAEKPGCRENNGFCLSDSDRSIYLFGGYSGVTWLNDLHRFSLETSSWTCLQESSESGADGGGQGGDAAVMENDSQVRGSVPSRRFGYVSVVHNGKLVIFGGTYAFGFRSFYTSACDGRLRSPVSCCNLPLCLIPRGLRCNCSAIPPANNLD